MVFVVIVFEYLLFVIDRGCVADITTASGQSCSAHLEKHHRNLGLIRE